MPSVECVRLVRTSHRMTRRYYGTIRCGSSMELAAPFSSTVARLAGTAAEGSRHSRGDVLVELDVSELAASRRELEASLLAALIKVRTLRLEVELERTLRAHLEALADVVERQIARNRNLHRREMVSVDVLDALEKEHRKLLSSIDESSIRQKSASARILGALAEVERVRAELDALDVRWSRAVIRAPCDLLVLSVAVRPGEWIAAGRPLMRVQPLDDTFVRVDVPPSDLEALCSGGVNARLSDSALKELDVSMRIPGTGSSVKGVVKAVSPAADEASQSLVLLISPCRERFPFTREGLRVEVVLRGRRMDGVWKVPFAALLLERGARVRCGDTVDMIRLEPLGDGGWKPVKFGASVADFCGREVMLEGLDGQVSEGDRVVLRPCSSLLSCERVLSHMRGEEDGSR